ncbi:T-cell surface glycoprotein CD4 isoform X2 [Emydura macquarii macquarii]
MGLSSMVVTSILAVFSVTQLGLIPTMAEEETMVFGAIGERVILPCIDRSQHDGVTWKYKNQVVIKHQDRILKGITRMTFRSDLNKQEISKGNFSLTLLQLENSDAGKYVCEVGSRTFEVHLQVFTVTGSPSGYLLSNESLTLKVQGTSSAGITWHDNHGKMVTHSQSRELENSGYSLRIHSLQAEDSGTWKCHIRSSSALLEIPYKVLVIGFHNWALETHYAAVNSTVLLSYTLSADRQKIGELENIKGGFEWKPEEDRQYQEKFNFSVTSKGLPWSKQMNNMRFTVKTSNDLQVKLHKVQFKDAGWYRSHFKFSRGRVEKTIHLVVMAVSANPVGPHSKSANVTLLCRLSGPLPPGAQLFWEHVNGTEKETQKEDHNEVKVMTKTAGRWRCSLKVRNTVVTSTDYTVEKAAEWNIYVLIGAGVGAGIVLLLLAGLCTFTCTARQRRRRRAEKIARVRQDLIEKRTCQCQ